MCLVTNYAAFGSTNVSVHGTRWGRLSQLHLFPPARLRLTTISIFPDLGWKRSLKLKVTQQCYFAIMRYDILSTH